MTERSSLGPRPTARATLSSSCGATERALRVVGEHVGQADDRGLDLGVVGVVALDHVRRCRAAGPSGGRGRRRPARGRRRARGAPLQALLRRARVLVDLARVAGIGVDEHELADVVQQRGDHQPVAVRVVDLGGQAVGRALGGDAVQAEALGRSLPGAGAIEEVEGASAAGEGLDGLGREDLDRGDDRVDPAGAALLLDAVGQAQHGDGQRDVGLDGVDEVAGRRRLVGEQAQDPVARLGQGREGLERLEGGGQTPAVALVVLALGVAGVRRTAEGPRSGVTVALITGLIGSEAVRL